LRLPLLLFCCLNNSLFSMQTSFLRQQQDKLIIEKAPVFEPLDPPCRLLCGPGPCNPHPRVLRALSMQEIGHLDSAFLHIMEEIKILLRYTWQTKNEFTIPVSGTGSAAMEACVCNLLEPGDKFLVGCNGYFGPRLVEMGQRYGASVVSMHKPWGQVFSVEELEENIRKHRPKVLALIHAETSTGACQPLKEAADICHHYDCLLVADTVTSISGVPLHIDQWNIDAAYAGSQKCLSCPPGIAPLTFGPRALEKLRKRRSKVKNWYLDMNLIASYLTSNGNSNRSYHHTAPINMCYGIREALALVAEEGLEQRWSRHERNAMHFWKGLNELGLTCLVPQQYRLPSLTTIQVPPVS
jgi:alanine-glyoxylate transaminase/serine-glyoxylate transaminase/serine-pyruvate transaminase